MNYSAITQLLPPFLQERLTVTLPGKVVHGRSGSRHDTHIKVKTHIIFPNAALFWTFAFAALAPCGFRLPVFRVEEEEVQLASATKLAALDGSMLEYPMVDLAPASPAVDVPRFCTTPFLPFFVCVSVLPVVLDWYQIFS